MRFWAKSAVLFLFLVFSAFSYAQNKKTTASNSDKSIVAEFKGVKITSDEFETAFKNVGIPKKENKADSLAEKKKFLELYVNYKMKIKDAEQKGFENDPEVINEYKDYRKTIGTNMLIEKEVISKGVNELYEKKKLEMRVSQIFVKFDSTQSDLGYAKAQKILDRILAGEKFEDLVKTLSDDIGSRDKGGDLYYVTAGDINIPEIENAFYETEPGKVCSKVFKTQVGFHIFKITEKKPKIYAMSVSHIMAAYKTGQAAPDTLAARKKILEAQSEMAKGMSFEDAAKKYSDDKSSAPNGGSLGYVSRGRFVREFDEKIMSMKSKEVSDIVQTPFGFHIIRVNDISPYPPLSEQEESLKKIYQETKYKADIENYILGLRKELKYKLNSSLYEKLINIKDSLYIGDMNFNTKIRDKFKDSLFVTINGKPYVADSIFTYMVKSGDMIAQRYNKSMVNKAHDKYFATELLAEKSYLQYSGTPEFESIMKDYKNGILLFRISEKEIWSKVKVDTNKVKEFWQQTKNNYTAKPRVTFREIYLTTTLLRDSVYNALKAGAEFDLMLKKSDRPKSEIPKNMAIDEDELAQKAYELKNVGDITEPFDYNGGWSIVRLDKKEDKRVKTYDEAKPEVSSILQEKETKRLEEVYVGKLKTMFKPKLYPENIKN